MLMKNHAYVLVALCCALTSVSAWADCMGEMQQATEKERALSKWVDNGFPQLIHVPDDYTLDTTSPNSSRALRCVNAANDPYYLSIGLSYTATGKTAASTQVSSDAVAEKMKQMMADMQQMQQEGASAEEIAARMEAYNKQLTQQSDAIGAQSAIIVKAYFNVGAAKCRGEPVKIPGAFAACRKVDREHDYLYVLFGAWKKPDSEQQDYTSAFSPLTPMSKLQNLALTIDADSDTMDKVLRDSDWSAIASRIER